MRRSVPYLFFSLLLAAGTACSGEFGAGADHRVDESENGTPSGAGGVPACPVDPDCAIGGDCSLYECPDYWVCDTHASGEGKRCTNPGPDYPDEGGGWDCEDVDGTTVCRGEDYPDGGGGGDWNCERRGEFVECSDSSPNYPDGGSGGPWNCWFEGEFRICENTPSDGGGWSCYDSATGRECRKQNPDYPDDRQWTCYDMNGQTVCQTPGSDLPDDGGGGEWNCESRAEIIECSSDSPDYPDDGGGGPWNCYFTQEFRVCRGDTPDDGGYDGPGDGDTDYPDAGDDECVPGVKRWCDDAVYCSWGKQTCLPDGSWGPCIEPTVTRDGLTDRPSTECGCRYFYFNDDCCEDQADRNGDGKPDCLIPEDHTPPACTSDGGLCSYCDTHGDCGGADDLCLFARDGYAFCSSGCDSDADCGAGYDCQSVTTREGTTRQCVPDGGRCE